MSTAVTYGLDTFSGNGAVDLAKARTEDNIQYLIRKATEGATYADPGFADDFDKCPSLSIQPGAYHFAHPETNSAHAEAQHFLRALAGRRGILALDLEVQKALAKLGLAGLADWSTTFLTTVHDATGIRPFLYTYHSWAFSAEFAALRSAWPLWIPLDPSQPGELVQATHAVGTIGTLDVDTFLGTLDDIRALVGLTTPPAQPVQQAPPVQPAQPPTSTVPNVPPLPEDDVIWLLKDPDSDAQYLGINGAWYHIDTMPDLTGELRDGAKYAPLPEGVARRIVADAKAAGR